VIVARHEGLYIVLFVHLDIRASFASHSSIDIPAASPKQRLSVQSTDAAALTSRLAGVGAASKQRANGWYTKQMLGSGTVTRLLPTMHTLSRPQMTLQGRIARRWEEIQFGIALFSSTTLIGTMSLQALGLHLAKEF
jgi:hypothetical protein